MINDFMLSYNIGTCSRWQRKKMIDYTIDENCYNIMYGGGKKSRDKKLLYCIDLFDFGPVLQAYILYNFNYEGT